MSTNSENPTMEESSVQQDNDSLKPTTDKNRTMGPFGYMSMWIGDGVNMGNMTLGASVIALGVATLNVYQTIAAAIIAIGIISFIFAFNDRLGYKSGIPYVVQLKMSFGEKGTIISSLLRGVPAVIWYGIQSWIGATALNEIVKIVSDGALDNIAVCFILLQSLQIVLSMFGFHAIKWVETVASVVLMLIIAFVFVILLRDHSAVIADSWVRAEGTWGLEFFGFIMVFMGNYAAIFLSAADYSRELKTGISNKKRGFLYFAPITIAYGSVIVVGAMLATATGYTNPARALPALLDNEYITIFISAFIVFGSVAVNMVANIVSPTYVIQLFTKLKYKVAVIITGLLGMVSFPWLLVKDSSAKGLDMFVLIYSAFLGPIVAILLVEYYVLRKQKVNVAELYKKDGQFAGFNPAAFTALAIGAFCAFLFVDLAWIIGFVAAGISYFLLAKFAFKGSNFKKGTIFESN